MEEARRSSLEGRKRVGSSWVRRRLVRESRRIRARFRRWRSWGDCSTKEGDEESVRGGCRDSTH